MNPPPPSRLLGLDLLRAVAILLVLLAHCPTPEASDLPTLISTLLMTLKRGGWVGVDLFFVLSGFLVSGLLMREHQRHGTTRVGSFLIRRGWKIYPPLIVFVIVMVPLQKLAFGYWPIDRFIAQVLFIQSYKPGIQVHLWSLAVEEHAYFLIAFAFGLAVFIAKRRGKALALSWMPWAIIACLALVLFLRVYNAQGTTFDYFTHQFPTHLRIDGILAGVLLAYVFHYHRDATVPIIQRYRPLLLVAGLVLILPPFIWTRAQASYVYTYGLTTNYLAGLCLLAVFLGIRPSENAVVKGLASIGRHSYSIYLWHMAAYELVLCAFLGELVVKPAWHGPYLLNLALFFSVSIVSGMLLSRLVEVPTLKLRDRLTPSRSGTIQAVDQGRNASDAQTAAQRVLRRSALPTKSG